MDSSSCCLLLAFICCFHGCQSAVASDFRDLNLADDELYGGEGLGYLLQRHNQPEEEEGGGEEEQEREEKEKLVQQISNWPLKQLDLGQISGVSVNRDNNPVIFHRGNHVFDGTSFNGTQFYRHVEGGPIEVDTILTLNSTNGQVVHSWGSQRFYLPHGLTIDNDGNTWITDVALHQVMKFDRGSTEPSLILGEAFVPGNDDNHFCKPTDVAVASNGQFFISDGYCNSRIMKYSPQGELMTEWGHSAGRNIFAIPHSLTLVEEEDLVCVADRENERIVCFSAGLTFNSRPGKFIYQISTKQFGKVFAVDYGGNGLLYGVAWGGDMASGFTLDLDSGDVLDRWTPNEGFGEPHDLSTSPDGANLYVTEIGPNRIFKFSLP